MLHEKAAPLSLTVSRTIAAPRARVFRAWIDPAAVKVWFLEPTLGRWTRDPEIDARPGGHYRFEGESNGKPWRIFGTYLEIRKPEKLVFTWLWNKEAGDSEETVVTVEFSEQGDATQVVVRHAGFAREADQQEHAGGWTECLEAIARVVARA